MAFVVLAISIISQPPKWLSDFDQSFYLTIAYDLDRHGIFSNGIFDNVDSTRTAPSPGMFFTPGYPLLVLAAMKMDPRFATAVTCSVEANHQQRDGSDCEVYATPIHVLHAILLALGVLAIAITAELIFAGTGVFWIAGVLATTALATEAEIFSFVMTESMTVSLYCIFALLAVLAWKTSRNSYYALAGAVLGLLCLTRPSFVVLIPAVLLLIAVNEGRTARASMPRVAVRLLVFAATCAMVLAPWIVRNHVSVGKWGLTEEYGSAVLIERFAYNDMTAREFVTAFPYCTPGIGDVLFDQVYGKDSMHRFVFHTRDSFFHLGRGRRDTLVQEHGRLDPLISGIVRDEMSENWWRHLLVSVPLGWCGMWIGWIWSLALVPLFAWACVRAVRSGQPLFLLYALPALLMLGLHAAVANHYTRYNLILIGPFAAGAAWIIAAWMARVRWRSQSHAPTP
ncbi:MAG: hypothetical protein QOG83_2729 [Alphaproteobacteria bacterium]|nr:hypothetical protein [Alphaproteobacteria bacterium]